MPCAPAAALVSAIGLIVLTGAPGPAQDVPEARFETHSAMLGDMLLYWKSGRGTEIGFRGVPVLAPNPAEFVVHRRWQQVLYRTEAGHPLAAWAEDANGAVLTIRDRTDQFAFQKRVVLAPDGSVRLEYEYELLSPEAAELQVLFGVGRPWLHGSRYRIVTGGETREGQLEMPETGRTDPWGGATEQSFATDYGTLTLRAEHGLNLYCDPSGGHVWWAQALVPGERYRRMVKVEIEPGPGVETGVRVVGLDWPRVVRNRRAAFVLRLARTEAGPRRVQARAEVMGPAQNVAAETVTAEFGDTPTEVRCPLSVEGTGAFSCAVVVSAADDGRELLRIAPLVIEASPLLRLAPRLSLYTGEPQGQIIADVAEDIELEGLSIEVAAPGGAVARHPVTGPRTLVPLDVGALPEGVTVLTCQLSRGEEVLGEAKVALRKAPPKPNEVKIDNLTRGLVVDGLPFIPFGFYTYFPPKPGIVDGEVVNGFNLFSPYHGGPHPPEEAETIRGYMDRCAAVGMRVNYHLMWPKRGEMSDEDWAQVRSEIEAIRDHPALLSWYIADEPPVEHVAPLERVAELLRELDPYHPITVVFYQGAEHARLFDRAMDIVMADPYPIPHGSVTAVSGTCDAMNAAFGGRKPLWVVPQAFGGNEGWQREPTAREQRVMTYLALVHGARAIQYFIRSPRVSFPKSPIMWAECGALALETAELTPALLSPEPAPTVTSSEPAIHACAFRDGGLVTVLAVNAENRPLPMRLEVAGLGEVGEARVLFEERRVPVADGRIEEMIDAFGTRAYLLSPGLLPDDDLAIDPANLTYDPSFEDTASVGTPAGCYAYIPPGATAFIDSRLARHGRHSLRLTAPTLEEAPSLSLFPVGLQAGTRYRISVWAKAAGEGVGLKLSLGGLGDQEFSLTEEWQEYAFTAGPAEGDARVAAGIALTAAGRAWLDLFQVRPAPADDADAQLDLGVGSVLDSPLPRG